MLIFVMAPRLRVERLLSRVAAFRGHIKMESEHVHVYMIICIILLFLLGITNHSK